MKSDSKQSIIGAFKNAHAKFHNLWYVHSTQDLHLNDFGFVAPM